MEDEDEGKDAFEKENELAFFAMDHPRLVKVPAIRNKNNGNQNRRKLNTDWQVLGQTWAGRMTRLEDCQYSGFPEKMLMSVQLLAYSSLGHAHVLVKEQVSDTAGEWGVLVQSAWYLTYLASGIGTAQSCTDDLCRGYIPNWDEVAYEVSSAIGVHFTPRILYGRFDGDVMSWKDFDECMSIDLTRDAEGYQQHTESPTSSPTESPTSPPTESPTSPLTQLPASPTESPSSAESERPEDEKADKNLGQSIRELRNLPVKAAVLLSLGILVAVSALAWKKHKRAPKRRWAVSIMPLEGEHPPQ
jgi:hypothetical protein